MRAKTTEQSLPVARPVHAGRRAYQTPALRRLGKVSDLTRGAGTSPGDSGGITHVHS